MATTKYRSKCGIQNRELFMNFLSEALSTHRTKTNDLYRVCGSRLKTTGLVCYSRVHKLMWNCKCFALLLAALRLGVSGIN